MSLTATLLDNIASNCATPATTDGGNNVATDTSCASGGTGDVSNWSGTDLGSLSYNGGPTMTDALLTGNPAIGAVSSGCLATDQRGAPRPGAGCDAGAYDGTSDPYSASLTLSPTTQSGATGGTAAVTASVQIDGAAAPPGLPLTFSVTGPDAATATAVTGVGGTATLSDVNTGGAGTDSISAMSPIGDSGMTSGPSTVSSASAVGVSWAPPIVAPVPTTIPTPITSGYDLVASDGGIFAFGDANFYGSTGATHLNEPIVGMASTPDGKGYWLVASDGGIFAFGDANFYGSTGATHLNEPIVGMAST